jgi:hypothetical protein
MTDKDRLINNSAACTASQSTDKLMTTLQFIHLNLIKCIELLNFTFGFQLMLCTGIVFLFIFFTLFCAYRALFYDTDPNNGLIIVNLYWSVYFTAMKILLIVMCHMTENENDRTSKLVYKLMNCNVCSSATLLFFGNQTRGMSAKSSCGLFEFDISLIAMVRKET